MSHRRIDPQRHRDQERQRQSEDRQQQRVGDHRPDAVGHRQAVVEGDAEITMGKIAQPAHVALRPGFVQPELALQLDSRLGTDLGVVAQPRHRTPRNEVDQGERQKRDPEDERDHLQQAANDVGGHRRLPLQQAPGKRCSRAQRGRSWSDHQLRRANEPQLEAGLRESSIHKRVSSAHPQPCSGPYLFDSGRRKTLGVRTESPSPSALGEGLG